MLNPALSSTILLAPVENGYLAYDSASEQVHELNPLAALIAELCDGTRTLEQIQEAVKPFLPAGKSDEVERWIDEGTKAGLLTPGGDAGASHRELSPSELFDLSRRLRRGGKLEMAFQCQQTVTRVAPENAEAWDYLGELAHIVGKRDQARIAYEKYLELEPSDAEVQHILVALRDQAPPPRASDEFVQQLYQRFSSFYEQNMCDDLGYEGPDRIRDVLNQVLTDRSGLTVLDLGCGSGLAGVQLRPRAASMTGIDLSPEMVDLAKARNIYDRLEVAEIGAWLEACKDRFDLIVACDCLIYFGDLRQVILPAARLLNDDGVFAFSVERGDRPPFRLTDSGRYAHHPDHVREVASEAGMEVESLNEDYLRMEYGSEVTGVFVALRKRSAR